MGNRPLGKPGSSRGTPAEAPSDTSESLPEVTEVVDHSTLAQRRDAPSGEHDDVRVMSSSQLYLIEARERIKAFTAELASTGNCDTNIVITGPVAVGVDKVCQEFQLLTENKFRLAGSSECMTEAATVAVDMIRSQRARALKELADRIGEQARSSALCGSNSTPLSASHFSHQLGAASPRKGLRVGGGLGTPAYSGLERVNSLPVVVSADISAARAQPHEAATSTPMLNVLHCDLRLQDEYLRAMRAKERKVPPPTKGGPRLRLFNGSVLDAVNVPINANNAFPVLDEWSVSTLEGAGNVAWRNFTELCPTANTLFVYLHFDNERYQRMYNAARGPLRSDDPSKVLMDRLEQLWHSHKQSADAIYAVGTPSSVTDRYFVMVIECNNLAMTNPCVLASIVEQVLSTVVGLRDQHVPVWGPNATQPARSAFITNPCWRTQRFGNVPENLIDNETIVPASSVSRASPPLERSLGRRLSGEIPRVGSQSTAHALPLGGRARRTSLDGAFQARVTV